MSIEIKARFGGRVLYTAETAADVRAALVEAVGKEVNLRGAYLRGAYLRGAYLRGAYLGGAYLGGADLGGADLGGAYLGGADLGGAYLGGAYLGGADLGGADLAEDAKSPLFLARLDFWAILDAAPGEVAGLREALVAGRIDGAVYEGECACLVGTIANLRGVSKHELPGIVPDGSRPAEEWFSPIEKGDVPDEATLEVEVVSVDLEAPRPTFEEREAERKPEGPFRATVALKWLDAWVESRTALVAAFNLAAADGIDES